MSADSLRAPALIASQHTVDMAVIIVVIVVVAIVLCIAIWRTTE